MNQADPQKPRQYSRFVIMKHRKRASKYEAIVEFSLEPESCEAHKA